MTDRDEDREGGGELPPEDVDRRFQELIKDLDTDTGVPEAAAPAAPEPTPPEEEPTLLELWDAELPDDEEDEYEPPEPPPLGWPSLPAIGGVLFILGGLVLLVRPDFAPLGTNPGRVFGFLAFVLGVWMLMSRLKDDSEDGDGDDGAVV